MPLQDYTETIILTIGPPNNNDPDLRDAATGLQVKTKAKEYFWYSDDSRDCLADKKDIRLYLHGHGNYFNHTLGGLFPGYVAQSLVEYFGLKQDTAKIISLTGCNAARGVDCTAAAYQAANVIQHKKFLAEIEAGKSISQKVVHPNMPHLTYSRLGEESRLVDTSREARQLCRGSFAQTLHAKLRCTYNISTKMYARLFVVSVDPATGEKSTSHYDAGKAPYLASPYVSHNKKQKSKVCLSYDGTSLIQTINYVTY